MADNVIIYGDTSQTVGHVPHARTDASPAPTYAIEDLTRADDAADRVLGSGSATVPAWSITTTADAGPDQVNGKRITTTSTTGATIGAAAAIVGADGQRETFRIGKVSTDAYIEAETELGGSYASGSTVYGIELTASVPDSLAADEDILDQRRPLRVVWTYAVDGVTYKVPIRLDLRRHTDAATAEVGEALLELRALYPDLPGRLPEGGELDRMVDVLAGHVATDLRRRKIRPETMMTGEQGRELIIARVIAHAAQGGYAPGATEPNEAWRRESAAAYKDKLEALTIGEPGEGVVELEPISDQATENPSRTMRGPTLRM